ncbi:MAG: ATPase, T2SS/T4P/T4SS family, partial [Candidatus Nanohaloarchaea archaeon]|nr:ATPase, T2SS/T4P/T4SS family [Candidatus Nanohaloarchaea archaeon]
WLKTDLHIDTEEEIKNYASMIGRRVGKQISKLHPLLDAHLITGDRTNATLSPISTQGNTITIRKFARDPWTVTDFIENGTITSEVASLLWLSIQYEMNVLISGGTGSGKCLKGDSEVVLADGDTRPIREIVEETFEENGRTETEDGWKVSPTDLEIFSFNTESGIEKKEVSKVWKRKAPEKMFRIETASGRKITATPEHPFFVSNRGDLQKKRADQLEEEAYIPVPRKTNPSTNSEELEVESWAEERGFIVAAEDKDSVNVRSERGKAVKLPKKLDHDMAEFLGLIVGDGHLHTGINRGNFRVEFHNSNPELRKRFDTLCGELFETDAVEEERKERVAKIQVYSRVLLEYLKSLHGIPSGAKSGSVTVPETVKKAEKSKVGDFLRGLFEADGTVSTNKSQVALTSASRKLVDDVSLLLKRFGIVGRKDSKDIEGKSYHRITIGPESLKSFRQGIGFISDRKKDDLASSIDSDRNTNVDTIPCNDILLRLKQASRMYNREIAERASISRRAVGCYLDGSRTPSRAAVEKIVEAFKQRMKELLKIKERISKIRKGIETLPSREKVIKRCFSATDKNGLEQTSIANRAGLGGGTISYWRKGNTSSPRTLEAFSQELIPRLEEDSQGRGIEYQAPDYDRLFSTIRDIRKVLNVTPTELKEETGIDIGVYEAGSSQTTTSDRLSSIFCYLHRICHETIHGIFELLPKLEQLADETVFWDRVKNVEEVESEDRWVYDLTVPGNHTFIADEIVAHNTSMLNVLTPFIPPNHRIVSIEDTREIRLPEFLHWVPLTTREPNPEGKGGVSMLDLLVNSLRMRPDRMIVGEIRRKRQAEVLFEAMHTGHSVYSTLHADTAMQTIRRLVNPPISVPKSLVQAIDLNVVMFRDRRRNIRRAMQVSEVTADYIGEDIELNTNLMYQWNSEEDKIYKEQDSKDIFDKLGMHAGLTSSEIERSLRMRKEILEWMVDNQVNDVREVGKVVAEFYQDEGEVYDLIQDGSDPEEIYSL